MARIAVLGAVLRRPSLWTVALRQVTRLAPRRWWRRRPFVPVPTRDYLAFRSVTQHGRADAAMDADDVVAYLRWCSEQRPRRRG